MFQPKQLINWILSFFILKLLVIKNLCLDNSLWVVSAGPGTSVCTSSVSWWYWSYLSNQDASWPKSSRTTSRRTAHRRTRQSTTAQTTTATRRTKPHEAQENKAQFLQQQRHLRRTRNHWELECVWRVCLPDEEPNIWCSESPIRQTTQVNVLSKRPSSKDDSNHTSDMDTRPGCNNGHGVN